MSQVELIFGLIGLATGLFALSCLLWSVLVPKKRLWPPTSARSDWIVWPVTFAHFGSVVVLAILGWGDFAAPLWLRVGLGGVMLILGHMLMIPSVRRFGYDKTSGADDGLVTQGLYRWSRNPQYVGDILILLGWCVLSVAPLAACVALVGIAVFIVAPLAEEPWLEAKYGHAYRQYKSTVRRFV